MNPEEFRGFKFKRFWKFQKSLEDSKALQKNPKNSIRIPKIREEFKIFQKIPKISRPQTILKLQFRNSFDYRVHYELQFKASIPDTNSKPYCQGFLELEMLDHLETLSQSFL